MYIVSDKKTVSKSAAVKILNEALEIDRKAITELVDSRVYAPELETHPTIAVNHELRVGLLGILNGIFTNAQAGDSDFITAEYSDTGIINRFLLKSEMEKKKDK